jgi:hypothetical protein
MSGFISTAPIRSGYPDVRRFGAAFHSVDFAMSRIPVARLIGVIGKAARPIGGARRVARLFVPAYEGGISINLQVPRSRNSDARRRLARVFETRRIVS